MRLGIGLLGYRFKLGIDGIWVWDWVLGYRFGLDFWDIGLGLEIGT